MVPVMLAFYYTDRKTVKERTIYRSRVCINSKEHENVMSFCRHIIGPPYVLGIWREWLFIFRELGSTCNYFQGFGEQISVYLLPCQHANRLGVEI